MSLEHVLLGFDARRVLSDWESAWPPDRRDSYLLRCDIPHPLSTDDMVWPSVFDHGNFPYLSQPERKRLCVDGFALPDWIGAQNPLWEDLDRLRRHLDSLGPQGLGPCWAIAITRCVDRDAGEDKDLWPDELKTSPPAVAPAWPFLGFDVSDQWLLSGLSNCGYQPTEIEAARKRWAPYLNEHLLFDAIEPAVEYRNRENDRVREHAPFFVYGLYLVEDRTGVSADR